MGLQLEFAASLCGGWLTDDANRLVRFWSLAPRRTAPAALADTRTRDAAERWFNHMARARWGKEWVAIGSPVR
jgi:hypothetical protein